MRVRTLSFIRHVILALTVVVAAGETASANVTVYPMQVFVQHPNRSAPVSITNISDAPMEVWVSFRYGFPVAFDTGNVTFNWGDTLGHVESNAAPWLRPVPQRVVLDPGEAQTVRLVVSPPGLVADGEYWARCVVSWKRSLTLAAQNGEKSGMRTALVTETIIPVHSRKGQLSSGVTMTGLTAGVQSKSIAFNFVLDRTGNAAFWGTAEFSLLNSAGKVVDTRKNSVVVYKHLTYSSLIDIEALPPGEYTLSVTLDNKHPALKKDIRLKSPPVNQSTKIIIP